MIWTLLAWGASGAAWAADVTVEAGGDWCAAVNAASPGDRVILAEGDYDGPCWITTSGEAGAPITLEGAGARIVYEGASSNVVDVAASHVTLSGLSFGPTSADIDAIKIRSGDGLTITGCSFNAVGGISVSANSADTSGLTVSDNELVDLQATGIYLGCHDGSCVSADFVIEGNVILGVTSSGVGYGMETKLGSYGVIRGNSVSDAQGPAVEVYGSEDGQITTVEGNLLIGSRNSATLEIGGGPALVRNNVVIGGSGAAVYVYDYGGRGLVQGITVQGNTVWGIGGAAVELSGWAAGADLRFDGNAVGRDDGASAMPDEVSGVPMEGNVDCAGGGACWADAAGGDLWPLPDGPLLGAGAESDPALTEDWCGWTRPDPFTAGALELGSGEGTLRAGVRQGDVCGTGGPGDTASDDTGDGDDTADDDTADDDTADDDTANHDTAGGGQDLDDKEQSEGCGCHAGGQGAGAASLVSLALLLVGRRARRRA